MLVLSRKFNEGIKLVCRGVMIDVVVVDIKGDKVRLGFTAPLEVKIHRDEVFEEIARQQQAQKPAAPD